MEGEWEWEWEKEGKEVENATCSPFLRDDGSILRLPSSPSDPPASHGLRNGSGEGGL